MGGVDCYDQHRNALTFRGGVPGVYHPPCRSWAKLKGFAKPVQGERDLALWSMDKVRTFGGVLEHPIGSELWNETGCMSPGIRDTHGGVLITVNQADYGHRATKATGLYLVGVPIPQTPFENVQPTNTVERMCKAERERTPLPFALFLVNLARSCS